MGTLDRYLVALNLICACINLYAYFFSTGTVVNLFFALFSLLGISLLVYVDRQTRETRKINKIKN